MGKKIKERKKRGMTRRRARLHTRALRECAYVYTVERRLRVGEFN